MHITINQLETLYMANDDILKPILFIYIAEIEIFVTIETGMT